MRRLIWFRADRGEIQRYREITKTQSGKSFYRVANADSVPSLMKTIAEHYDCSDRPIPIPGYRLTETVPEDRDSFRDSGWEVVRVEEYTPDIPAPYGSDFDTICICYCAYKPLAPEEIWTKKSHRLAPSLASFGGDETAYGEWLETQPEDVQIASKLVTEWGASQ